MTTRRKPSVRGSAEDRRVVCVLCGLLVNTRDRSGAVEREVVGWETLRRRGGANRIADRKETGRWRHHICGASPEVPGQSTLFEESPE